MQLYRGCCNFAEVSATFFCLGNEKKETKGGRLLYSLEKRLESDVQTEIWAWKGAGEHQTCFFAQVSAILSGRLSEHVSPTADAGSRIHFQLSVGLRQLGVRLMSLGGILLSPNALAASSP